MGTADGESGGTPSEDAALKRLAATVAVADEILRLVDTHAPAGVQSRDRNDQFLVLTAAREVTDPSPS
jgi:hypothetical protein